MDTDTALLNNATNQETPKTNHDLTQGTSQQMTEIEVDGVTT
jgi:hypothetical protein